jgi:hypothetical protein
MLTRLGVLVVAAVSTVVLGGCVSIQSITSEQQDVVGKLRLTFTICASDIGVDADATNEDHPGCPDLGNGGLEAATLPDDTPLPTQILFGLRVPTGTGTPATLSATPVPAPPAVGTIVLRRSAGYESVLQAAAPAPGGSTWVGYMSDPYLFDNGASGVVTQSTQMSVDLALPPTGDGGPFVGPLPVRPVLGSRRVSAALPADRPIDCGDDPYRGWPRGFFIFPEIVCIDTPTALQMPSSFNFQTRDFGVLAGKATASPGQTVTLPFNVRGAGALPAGLTAALSAATALPGAGVVTPSVGSAALSNGSDTRVTVPVAIPKAAGPGVFDVSVTGRLENGQTRTGVAKLTVRDRQKPVLSKLKAKPKRFKAATKRKPKRGTNVSFALNEAASLRLTVERCGKRAGKRKRGRCVRWKALKGGLTKPGVQGANQIRFNGRLRGKALKAGGYRLVLKPTDGARNVGKVARTAIVVRG